MTLLLHVGLPKTGTTSLQRLLRQTDLAVGLGVRLFVPDLGAHIEGWDLVPDGTGLAPIEHRADQLRHLRSLASSAERTLVVSMEWLTNPGGGVTKPDRRRTVGPAARIRKLLALLDPSGRSTHIACGIRPAVEWIQSAFAQSPGVGGSISASAETWIALPDDDPWNILNFNNLDDMLSEVVDPARVRFLPLHQFGNPEYFRAFAGATTFDWEILRLAHQQSPARVNVRRDGARWRAAEPIRLRGRLATRYPNGIAHRLIISNWNLPLRVVSAFTWRPRREVQLDGRLRARVLERYGPSAREFAARRDLMLEGHGYW